MTRVLRWVREHDDRLSFVVLYVGGAIALSIWLNLFWVAMLMLCHFFLEILRGRLVDAEQPVLHALWEVKLDIALLLFALVVALYSEQVLALLGLGQAARAGQAARGIQAVARFGIVERALRIVVLTMDDMARLVQAVIRLQRNGAEPASVPAEVQHEGTPPAAVLGKSDVASLVFAGACLLLILSAPSLTGATAAEVGTQILVELSPFR
jgi:hypothetical protein